MEGKNLSELVRELLVKYTKERDMSGYFDDLWNRIGQKLSSNKVSDADIEIMPPREFYDEPRVRKCKN